MSSASLFIYISKVYFFYWKPSMMESLTINIFFQRSISSSLFDLFLMLFSFFQAISPTCLFLQWKLNFIDVSSHNFCLRKTLSIYYIKGTSKINLFNQLWMMNFIWTVYNLMARCTRWRTDKINTLSG